MKTQSLRSNRGSVLIVALILSAVVAISLTSYVRLGVSSQRISNRALYNNAAMNLAENGLEEAMYSINKMVADSSYNWSGWKNNGTDAWAQFPTSGTYTFDQKTTGYVRIYVQNYKGVSAPTIISKATINLGGAASAPIEKWVEVKLAKTSKFANGLVAKDTILFKGNNATVDSWNSEMGGAGTYTPFSNLVKKDNGSVGSVSISVDSVLVQNADIWGYVSTNNADDPTDNVGANGSILGANSVNDGTWKKANVDPNRVSTQFSANFDPVSMPTLSTPLGSLGTTTTLTSGTYTYSSISLAAANQLNISGNVVILITASAGSSAIDIKGNAGINIAPGASLKIYTAGDIAIGGNGVANGGTMAATANAPVKFQIYGTSTSTSTDQNISIAGNGVLSGIIYAPNGDVKINGNGDVMGSVVAEDITLVGNAKFHYDESLGNLDTGNPFRVAKWKELTTAADRAAVASKFNF
jgi:Tfp pilus assembly protein PilX